MSVMELGHLLTRSGLTYLEVSSEVFHDSFCQLGNSVSLSWVVCREAFCLHVVSSSSCVPVVCLEPVLLISYTYTFINYKTLITAHLTAAISRYGLLNAQDSDQLSEHYRMDSI